MINTSEAGFISDEQGNPVKNEAGELLIVWPLIVDYEIPLTDPNDIGDIESPGDWGYEILSDSDYLSRYGEENPFDSSYILHWHDNAISWDGAAYSGTAEYPIALTGYTAVFGGPAYENQTNGFVFSSNFAPVDGPYASSWQDAARYIADPPLPGGNVGGGGTVPYQPRNTPVPEPATMVLFGIGMAGIFARKKLDT